MGLRLLELAVYLFYASLAAIVVLTYGYLGFGSWLLLAAGLALSACGFVLWRWARRALGPYHAILPPPQGEHRLVTAGPYRWVRHPLYLGLLLLYLGGCLALGSWVGLGLWAVVFLPFHGLRALREEGFLIEKHGEEYLRYMDSAGFLWPRLPGPPAA